MEGFGDFLQLGKIVGHFLIVVVAKGGADGAVDVHVQHGHIAFVRAVLQNSIPQPADVFSQLFAVTAKLGVDVVDQGVGKHLGALDNHLVGVIIAVIAGLGEDGNRRVGHGAAVLVGHYLAHETARGFGNGVQDSLGHTVADGGVQTLALHLNGLHHGAQATEIIGFLAHQLRLDVLVNDGNEIPGQE